jgi:nucleotide-binding universal stress UspA family protein
MFKHILIAHDLSSEADLALQRALQLAAQHQARLSILHVVGPDQSREVAEEALAQRLDADSLTQVRLVFDSGKPTKAVIQQLEELGCDLLVVGQHHKGRPELFSGTVLERLAREAVVPLLLVSRYSLQPYRQALAALDYSTPALKALRAVQQMLPADGSLCAINVLDQSLQLPPVWTADAIQRQTEALRDMLREELGECPAGCPPVEVEVHSGILANALDQAISAHNPELLAIGQQAHSRISEVLLGNLPSYYLRQPPCDILVVK